MKIYILLLFGLIFYQCGDKVSSNAANKKPTPNINRTAETSPTPPDSNTTAEIKQTPKSENASGELSDCAKERISGLPEGGNISSEMCFDRKKPVDKGEREKGKVESGNNALNSRIEFVDEPFEKLPAEVQKVIRLTAPDLKPDEVLFTLQIDLVDDPTAPTEKLVLVKQYQFSSYSKNKEKGKDPNSHNWSFMRQDKLLKLDSAEIIIP